MSPIGMTLLLLSTLAFFAWTASRRWRQLGIGVPDPEFDLKREGEVGKRIDLVLTYALGQKKMPYYSAAGIAHIFIFAGFNVLLLNSIMLWGRGFDEGFTFWGLLSTDHIVDSRSNSRRCRGSSANQACNCSRSKGVASPDWRRISAPS